MKMHDPPHPGEFIRGIYIEPFSLTIRKVAEKLDVSPSTFSRLINGKSSVTPEMALRLSKAIGRSPESWLTMQGNYDLWHASKRVHLGAVEKIHFSAA
jgi:addiction module HigA family antidote